MAEQKVLFSFDEVESALSSFGLNWVQLGRCPDRWPPHKNVICYRCLYVYDQTTAPTTRTKRLSIKEKCCPKCECKVYFS